MPRITYRYCDECGYEFEIESTDSGALLIDGECVKPETDGSGWTLTTIHGPNECDSTLIIHK